MSLESLPDEELLDRWNTTVEDEARTAILQVLQKSGCIIPRIELLSRVAINNLKDLKLDLHYPILLYGESTIDDVRKMIQSAQQSKGQEPGATGGNGTKRIGIYVKTGPTIAAAGLKAVLD